MITFRDLERLYDQPRELRERKQNQLLGGFRTTLMQYSSPADPYDLRKYMPPEEYLKFLDTAEDEEEDDDHE